MSMLDEKDFQKQKIKPETWKVIFRFAAKYRRAYAGVLGGSAFAGLMDLGMSFMTMWAIDGFMARRDDAGAAAFCRGCHRDGRSSSASRCPA